MLTSRTVRVRVGVLTVWAIVGIGACGQDAAEVEVPTSAPTTTLPYTVELVGAWPLTDVASGVAPERSGNGLDGSVGTALEATSEGITFPAVEREPDTQRTISIPDQPGFDVGAGEFVVSIRVRTTDAGEHNLVQHGQNDQPTFWKVELNANGERPGVPHCTFVGDVAAAAVAGPDRIDDGEWHTITCRHTATKVRIEVDGETRDNDKVTGVVANDDPLTIGGKPFCDGADIECDYYVGVLADLQIEVRTPR